LQKDIVSILENSLLLKSHRSSEKEPQVCNKINKKSVSTPNRNTNHQILNINTRSKPSPPKEKDTLSRNEMLLLEKILQKDDEIKTLRTKLDKFQIEKIKNQSCKIIPKHNISILYKIIIIYSQLCTYNR
jgi:predicted type IV restriction endonuclease